MNNISLIAAIGKNNELGKDNKLIWYLPSDLKFFKETTMNNKIVMGYNTFLSIGKALPKRKNIVLTSKDILIPNVTIYHNIDDLLSEELNNDEELFIIGGSSVYNLFYPLCDKMYLTEIDEESEADVYFPSFDKNDWDKEIINHENENGISYDHVLYRRRIK